MNRCLIRKADALAISGQYETAQQEYMSVSSKSQKVKVIGLIHLADLYMRKGEEEKLDKVIL